MPHILSGVRPWLIGAALLTLSTATMSHAASAAAPIRLTLNDREVPVDVSPVIENGRTMVPMRAVLEAMGAKVDWNQSLLQVTATLGSTTVKTTLGATKASVNQDSVTLDEPTRLVQNRVLVPLRFFMESFGMRVGWDGGTRTVLITGRATTTASRDSSTVNRQGLDMATLAKSFVGSPYAWGGTTPAGFDCSGFVYYIANRMGISLPHSSFDMFNRGVSIDRANILAGDLVFFTTYTSGASHVGIYLGDGTFVEAQNEETGVKITSMWNPWWSPRYLGARRITR
jgi:cell wall-associated NlpC family hydrolase